MHNEADSVNDREWAMGTRLAAGRFGWRAAGLAAAVFTLLGAAHVLFNQFCWRLDTAELWPGVMILTSVVGALLGLRRVGPLEAGAGALAFLPGAWLTVVALQATLGDAAPNDPRMGDQGVTVLAVIAACAAGSVRSLAALRRSAAP